MTTPSVWTTGASGCWIAGMALLNLKWIPRYLRWRDPFRKGAQEASDQYLGKAAKIQTLNDLTMNRDLRELSEADHEGVRALRTKHGFGPQKRGWFMGKDGDRDSIACDDMTINSGRSGLLEFIVGAALCAAAFWFFGDKLKPASASPVEVNVPDTAYDVLFYDKDGNQITVPRLPSSP